MNKEHFLTELKIHLKPLPKKQAAYILQLYNEKFTKRMAEGEEEIFISKDLGSPKELAQEILAEFGVEAPTNDPTEHDEWKEFTEQNSYNYYEQYDSDYERRPNKPSFFVRFCQIAGVLSLNFLFMFWIIFAGLALLFAGWMVLFVLLLSPIVGVVAYLVTFSLFQVFFATFLFGIGLFGLLIAIPVTKYSFKFLKYYTVWNLNVLRGVY